MTSPSLTSAEARTPSNGASARRWAALLDQLVPCPGCGAFALSFGPAPRCEGCGWQGTSTEGIPDLVDSGKLNPHHEEELSAQAHAVGEYYENEDKVCCHWDRISAEALPARLGWPTGIVLDLGCGTGSAGGAIRRAGARVVGADLSVACLQAASRRLDAVVRVDAAALPFGDAVFDGVVARGALHHLDDASASLAEAARVLKPGSPALFLDPREYAWLEPIKDRIRATDESFSHDHHAYRPEEYRALIAQHFEVEEVYAEHPFGVLVAAGLDLVPVTRILPARRIAGALHRLDAALNRTPLRRAGHLLVVKARKR